jgi:cytochrome c oxidase subunit II
MTVADLSQRLARAGVRLTAVALAACTTACAGIQSALVPAGEQAERVAVLFWFMSGGAVAIWIAVVALALFYGRPHEAAPNRRRDRWLIVGGGVVFPLVVLTLLLAYGLAMIPPMVARAPEGSLMIEVDGEMWWWRVRYVRPGQDSVELANEIRLPVGEPVQFRLTSDNVIHSFWIPSLGGKMDMIPGRVTYLALHPTRTGRFAGACAEYCGTSHALMRFYADVVERANFDAWLQHQAMPAATPSSRLAVEGQRVFRATGCGACHTVRGTDATARIGPDLTHVAGRSSLAAGTLTNELDPLLRWVAHPDRIKPGVHMPAFGMLADDELRALAAYLQELR